MKKNTIIIITVLLLLACATLYAFKEYLFKPSRNISAEVPAFQMPAGRLIRAYDSSIHEADSLYLNKTIEISGVATRVMDSVVEIESTVFCLFDEKVTTIATGKRVTVKGKCIGYDELFQEIKLDQCTINK